MQEKQVFRFEISTVCPLGNLGTLIANIPDNWKWMDGYLTPPENPPQPTIPHVGYRIGYTDMIQIIRTGGKPIDMAGVANGNHLPGFVAFESAGLERQLALPKMIASNYVLKRYTGRLDFYSSDHRNTRTDTPEKCQIEIFSYSRPPMVSLSYDPQYGGCIETITPLLHTCRLLFHEYKHTATIE